MLSEIKLVQYSFRQFGNLRAGKQTSWRSRCWDKSKSWDKESMKYDIIKYIMDTETAKSSTLGYILLSKIIKLKIVSSHNCVSKYWSHLKFFMGFRLWVQTFRRAWMFWVTPSTDTGAKLGFSAENKEPSLRACEVKMVEEWMHLAGSKYQEGGEACTVWNLTTVTFISWTNSFGTE